MISNNVLCGPVRFSSLFPLFVSPSPMLFLASCNATHWNHSHSQNMSYSVSVRLSHTNVFFCPSVFPTSFDQHLLHGFISPFITTTERLSQNYVLQSNYTTLLFYTNYNHFNIKLQPVQWKDHVSFYFTNFFLSSCLIVQHIIVADKIFILEGIHFLRQINHLSMNAFRDKELDETHLHLRM